jgi:hypothetical protein
MLPPLQFDLRPRAGRPVLRIALVAIVVVGVAAAVLWLRPQHAELTQLRAATDAAAGQAAPTAPSAPGRPSSWQAAADQDGALFDLPLEPRLLEIERCTDAKTVVTRIVHDATAHSTSLELITAEPDAVRALLECLNQSVQTQQTWRLISVEAQAAGPAAGAMAGQRVVLRHP